MSAPPAERRPLRGLPAAACALLDAFALWLDLGAAAGRHPLLRTPIAIGARALSTGIRFWSTSWVGAVLGLSWVFRTYRQSQKPPLDQVNEFVAQQNAKLTRG